MTLVQLRNRSYNLLITTVLFLIGLGFGSSAIPEGEAVDKIDDIGLFVVGIIALGWYMFAGMRLQKTAIPLALAVVALGVQILGVVLEVDDQASFGDNIGGMLILAPLAAIAVWQYLRPLPINASSGTD